jgi:hypothetical protein
MGKRGYAPPAKQGTGFWLSEFVFACESAGGGAKADWIAFFMFLIV